MFIVNAFLVPLISILDGNSRKCSNFSYIVLWNKYLPMKWYKMNFCRIYTNLNDQSSYNLQTIRNAFNDMHRRNMVITQRSDCIGYSQENIALGFVTANCHRR